MWIMNRSVHFRAVRKKTQAHLIDILGSDITENNALTTRENENFNLNARTTKTDVDLLEL